MRKTLIPLLITALALSACAHKPVVKPEASAGSTVPGQGAFANGAGGAGANAAGSAANGGEDVAGPEQGLLATRVIYFDFDSSDIHPDGLAVVTAHAKYLVAHPDLHVRLEGNTDERGSREYNIGLGERRAQAVRRALLLQGVAESQVSTVSFGAEHPAVEGHDESAWAKNRRVEINYTR
ncbi:MAG TPA: peptidoglycan-associated lipoprotein Pal [Steroidobacteraceae bacterium]|nr:peptidoglycan-associated lipoprotein Pal [Steroidobacteraceae bacterium]